MQKLIQYYLWKNWFLYKRPDKRAKKTIRNLKLILIIDANTWVEILKVELQLCSKFVRDVKDLELTVKFMIKRSKKHPDEKQKIISFMIKWKSKRSKRPAICL